MIKILNYKNGLLFYCVFLALNFILLSVLSKIYIFNIDRIDLQVFDVVLLILFEFVAVFTLILSGIKLNRVEINAKTIFKAMALATTIFLFQYLVEFFWLLFNKNSYEPNYLRNFSIFSLYQIYHPVDLPSYLLYPLQTINIWEVLYIISIVFFIRKLSNNKEKGLGNMIYITYSLGVLSWMVFVTFINAINGYL